MPFLETSAMMKINIDKAFEMLVAEIHKKFKSVNSTEEDDVDIRSHTIDITQNNRRNSNKKKDIVDKLKQCCK
jgi:hypothetical protein